MGDVHRADDLVQDTLARAWDKRRLWRAGSDLRAWLFAIMHNVRVSQFSLRQRERAHVSLDADIDAQREFRQRFIPSGLAKEIFLDVYQRVVSFEPGVPFPKRLYDAYAAEVARVGHNGVVSAAEGDADTASDGFADNSRLFIPATQFNRFAVTREINDGLLAPRFAPSQKAWVLSGTLVPVSPSVPASADEDGDDR